MTTLQEIEFYSQRSEKLRLANEARKSTLRLLAFIPKSDDPYKEAEIKSAIHDNAAALGTLSGLLVAELKLEETFN